MHVWKAHRKRVHSLAYSPEGTLLASAGADGEVVLWNPIAGKAVRRFEEEKWYRDIGIVLFLMNGTCLAGGDTLNGRVLFWDLESKDWTQVGVGIDSLSSIAVSPDDRFLAAGGAVDLSDLEEPERAFELKLWALQEGGKDRDPFCGHEDSVSAVAFAPAGGLLASGSDDRSVRLWDIASRKCIKVLKPQKPVRQVAFSPDGKMLAAVIGWRGARLWKLPAGRGGPTLEGHGKTLHALAFSPDSRRVATGGGDKTVKLWDVQTGKEEASFDWGIGQVRALAFAPDGMTAAAGGENGKIAIWDLG